MVETGRKMALPKATIDELITLLQDLMQNPIPNEKKIIDEVVQNPSVLVGCNISHIWQDDTGTETIYKGTVNKITEGDNALEFQISYIDTGEQIYQTLDEVLVDITCGDLHLQHL